MTNTDRLWLELATIRELAAELAPTATAATLAILYRRVSAAWRAFLASVPGPTIRRWPRSLQLAPTSPPMSGRLPAVRRSDARSLPCWSGRLRAPGRAYYLGDAPMAEAAIAERRAAIERRQILRTLRRSAQRSRTISRSRP